MFFNTLLKNIKSQLMNREGYHFRDSGVQLALEQAAKGFDFFTVQEFGRKDLLNQAYFMDEAQAQEAAAELVAKFRKMQQTNPSASYLYESKQPEAGVIFEAELYRVKDNDDQLIRRVRLVRLQMTAANKEAGL